MEERHEQMSRAELSTMIAQLEEVELRAASKPASELSGIRTKPGNAGPRKRANTTQEERHLSWAYVITTEAMHKTLIIDLTNYVFYTLNEKHELCLKKSLKYEYSIIVCRLSRTEARLSQSLDENRRLREDLKDMLDSQIELQQSMVTDTADRVGGSLHLM